MRARATLACLVALGCGDSDPTLEVVLDLPDPSAASYPFGDSGVDALRLAVAREGEESDLLLETAQLGEPLNLDSIPFGRDLVLHLVGENSGVDVAYGRSCSFDFESENDGPESIHIYFSRVVRFGNGPAPLVENRVGGHAFPRANGSLVLAGGREPVDLELFNPRSGRLSVLEEAPTTVERIGGHLASLGNDEAVIVGGVDRGGAPVAKIERLPNLRDSLEAGLEIRDHDVASLVSGGVLVAGGALYDGNSFAATAEAFRIETGEGGVLEAPAATGSLAFARHSHTLTRLSDEVGAAVLAAGGIDDLGQPVDVAEVYRPLAGTFETVVGTLSRWQHSAVRLPGGAVLIIGGFQPRVLDGEPEPARDLILFDPIGGSFNVGGVLPDSAPITDFSLTDLPDGRVLMTGGRDAAGELSAESYVIRFDVINGLVDMAQTDPLATPRADHAATRLCDGTILVTGGEAAQVGAATERYNPIAAGRR